MLAVLLAFLLHNPVLCLITIKLRMFVMHLSVRCLVCVAALEIFPHHGTYLDGEYCRISSIGDWGFLMEPKSLLQSNLGARCLRHGCGVHELNRMAFCCRAVASSSGLVAIACGHSQGSFKLS